MEDGIREDDSVVGDVLELCFKGVTEQVGASVRAGGFVWD